MMPDMEDINETEEQWGAAEETQAPTIDMLKKLVNELWAVRQEKDSQKQILSKLSSQESELEELIIRTMRVSGLERFDIDKCSVFANEKASVRVPSEPEAKKKFFSFLFDLGLHDSMVTVNSNTLNSWYKKEIEVRRGNGQPEFQVPGLDEPTKYWDLSVRKK